MVEVIIGEVIEVLDHLFIQWP